MVLKVAVFILFGITLFSCSNNDTSELSKPEQARSGESLYLVHCESCHGQNGDKGTSGAANLITSTIKDKKIKHIILKGNDKGMMGFADVISKNEEIENLITYLKSLRK